MVWRRIWRRRLSPAAHVDRSVGALVGKWPALSRVGGGARTSRGYQPEIDRNGPRQEGFRRQYLPRIAHSGEHHHRVYRSAARYGDERREPGASRPLNQQRPGTRATDGQLDELLAHGGRWFFGPGRDRQIEGDSRRSGDDDTALDPPKT